MPSSGDDETGENEADDATATDHTDHADTDTATEYADSEAAPDQATDDADPPDVGAAETALSAAIEAADGDPSCALCPKPADYFLYERGHVEKFVCWEHVSPHSAAVDSEDARPGRPLALSL